jgi:hypothetical protein
MVPILAEAEAIGAGIAAVAFFAFLAIAVITASGQERQKSALAHAERLRRLELGLDDLPRDRAWPQALVCIMVGGGVPAIAFFTTLAAYLVRPGVSGDIWFVPLIVSTASVIVAGTLASQLLKPLHSSPSREPGVNGAVAAAKPEGDPDAFDVVGRRG